MTTRQLAEQIAAELGQPNPASVEAVHRTVLSFLVEYADGYGAASGPRGDARDYARRNGYFWLPCVLCGQWRGGHERGGVLWTEPQRGIGVCGSLACLAEAVRLNKLYPDGISGVGCWVIVKDES